MTGRVVALAVGFVLIGSADWELVAPTRPDLVPICSKSEAICRLAVDAIRAGRWSGADHPTSPTVNPVERAYDACRSAPSGCFSERLNCIHGYNCRDHR